MKQPSDLRGALWLCLGLSLLLAWPVLRYVVAPMMGGMVKLTPATPTELAASQAAYDHSERNGSRGSRFCALADDLDRTGRGVMTEQEIVARLGPPDGQLKEGTFKLLVYYWDRFGSKDWYAAADMSNGVLVHFAYNTSSSMRPSELRPYVPAPATTSQPATSPATTPSQDAR
jgi:hypothetical protein